MSKKGSKTKQQVNFLEASPEKAFYMVDGRVITKLTDLSVSIATADENTFAHHVNSERNDFGNWIKDVFGADLLAQQVYNAGSRAKMIKVLETSLK